MTPLECPEIDPVQYGALSQQVRDMDKKLDRLEKQIDELLQIANQGKGGLWVGVGLLSALSGALGSLVQQIKGI